MFVQAMLMSVAAKIVDINDVDVSTFNTPATYQLQADGDIFVTGPGGGVIGDWLIAGTGADYEVRATIQSGAIHTATSSPTGSWLSLSSGRNWTCVAPPSGLQSATLLVEIRLAANQVVQDSATIDLSSIDF